MCVCVWEGGQLEDHFWIGIVKLDYGFEFWSPITPRNWTLTHGFNLF